MYFNVTFSCQHSRKKHLICGSSLFWTHNEMGPTCLYDLFKFRFILRFGLSILYLIPASVNNALTIRFENEPCNRSTNNQFTNMYQVEGCGQVTVVPTTGDIVTVKVQNVNPRAAKVGLFII